MRFGCFDYIDDPEVSKVLLRTVEEWGRKRGMTQIAGPMGFADTDREGMLVEGFDSMSTMYANHNYPYYVDHINRLGFRKDNDYVECLVKVPETVPEKIAHVARLAEEATI